MPKVPVKKGPQLLVEGLDDFHVIRELLARHGIAHDQDSRCPWIKTAEPGHNKDALLRAVIPEIAASGGLPVGFVIDANGSAQETWNCIARKTRTAGVPTPEPIPKDGFVGYSDRYEAPVGIWVMPDNGHVGALEEFLERSIPADDALFTHACHAAHEAKSRGARFSEQNEHKAILYTWLAWQETPGRFYSKAVADRFFDAHSEIALRFLAWFRQLYQLTETLPA